MTRPHTLRATHPHSFYDTHTHSRARTKLRHFSLLELQLSSSALSQRQSASADASTVAEDAPFQSSREKNSCANRKFAARARFNQRQECLCGRLHPLISRADSGLRERAKYRAKRVLSPYTKISLFVLRDAAPS